PVLARDRQAAAEDRELEAFRDQGAGEQLGAPVMADAEQVLHVEGDLHRGTSARLARTRRGPPSRSSANRWAALQSSRAGGLPMKSQPVARPSSARITP